MVAETGSPSPTVRRRRSRRSRKVRLVAGAALGATTALAPLGAHQAAATPGYSYGNWFIFDPEPSNPTNGRLYVYENTTLVGSYRAGSGTSDPANQTPCNKEWGNDADGGGRLPGQVSYGLYTVGPLQNDASLYKKYILNDAVAQWGVYGATHDCTGNKNVTRTALRIHSKNPWNNYISDGCIKINQGDMDASIAIYTGKGWGAAMNEAYHSTLQAYDI